MVAKIFLIALSCVFIVQIHHVHCQNVPLPPETQSRKDFTNEIAQKTINTMLRHLRISVTHPVSAPLIRHIATSVRMLLTDEIGQKNVQHFIDFVVDLLMNSNTLATVETFHKRLVELAAAGQNAPIVLETAAMSTRKILDEPKLLEATEGFVEGINVMLDGMTEEKLRAGIRRVKSMTKLASFFKPIVGVKIPTLEKLKRSNSDSMIRYESTDGEVLQSRDLSWVNNPALTMHTTNNADSVNTNI